MTYKYLERKESILGGKPIIKGTPISVASILEWLATGGTPEKINEAYPQVAIPAIQEALLYASKELANTD